ncbi:MAG TPA: DNA primase [Nitrospiraceae bacterium]|nr:DNA primase [Nitrospiraceae bacterium]
MGRGLISEDVINQVRDRVDIAEVVGHHVSLTRAGQNLKGLCPFHQEKSPSFTVSPSRQIFHCFGCGAGGNVFTFLMRITGANFPETVRELGQKFGIDIPDSGPSAGPHAAQASRIEPLNRAAMAWFQQSLRDGVAGAMARDYLASRGIRPETIERFEIGCALAEWDGLIKALSKQGFAQSDLAAAGLTVAREHASGAYDRFRARVMFPITDLRKRVVGFGGRILGEGTPKYLNSPDTPLFKKGQTLYALDLAREAVARLKTVIVVEGYFDAVALHQAGLTHTVATLGTALTAEHIQVLRRFASKVVLLFDPDQAGVRAALRGLDLFVNSGLGVKVVTLPAGEDPDTYVRKEGPEAFTRLEEQAPSLLDFALEHSVSTAESSTIEGRIRSVDDVLRILQKSEHPIEREERIRVVAERLGVSQQRLVERYPALVQSQSEGRRPASAQSIGLTPATFKGVSEERDLVYLLLHGHLTAADVQRLRPEAFSVPACRSLVEAALSHLDRDGRVGLRLLLNAVVDHPDCGSLATELSMREDHFDDLRAHVAGCLETLDRKRAEAVFRDLIMQLKAAEREGRTEDAQRLNAHVNELRMQKAGRPTIGMLSLVKE